MQSQPSMQPQTSSHMLRSTVAVLIGIFALSGSWTQSANAQTLVETNGNALDAPGSNNGAGLSGSGILNTGGLNTGGLNTGGLNFPQPGAISNFGVSGIPNFSTPTTITNPAFSDIPQGPTFGALQNTAFPGISDLSVGFSNPIPGQLPNNFFANDTFFSGGSFGTSFQVQDVGDLGLSLPSVGSFGVSTLTPLTPSIPQSISGSGGSDGTLFGTTIDFSSLGIIDNSVFQNLTADPNNLAESPAVHAYFEEESKINAPLFGPSDLPKFDMSDPMKVSQEEFSRALGLDGDRNLSITTSSVIAPPPNTHMGNAFDNVVPDASLAILRPLEYGGIKQTTPETQPNRPGAGLPNSGDSQTGELSETDRVIQEVDAYLKTLQHGSQNDDPNLLWDTGGAATGGGDATGGNNADILSSADKEIPGFIRFDTPSDNAILAPPSMNMDPTRTIPDAGDTYQQMQNAAKWMDNLKERQAAMGSSGDQPMTVSQSAMDALDYVRASDQHPFGSFTSSGASARDTFVRTAEKHLKNEQFHKALAQYAIAAVADPGNALIFLGQGHAHLGAGEFFSAARKLMQGIELFPGIAYFKMDLTEFMDPHTLDIRRADLEKRLSKKDDYRFRFLLGYIEFYTGLEEYGIENLRKAAEKAPKASTIARFPDILMLGAAIREDRSTTTSDVP